MIHSRSPRAVRGCLLIALLLPAPLRAQPVAAEADGRVLADEPCPSLPSHSQLDAFGRGYFDEASWDRIRGAAVECRHIHYASGGQPVEGYLLRPDPHREAARLPAIIYNRGGTGDYGRIDAPLLAELRLLAEQGFVVAASNYRFIGDLARKDEWGGADLEDVLNLVPLLKGRRDVDPRNLFMLGLSRGGVMTYLAIKRKAPINAAAVIAGATDLTRVVVDRPEFVLGDEGYDGWARVWPEFATRSRDLLEARSAVFWPGEIGTPVLILHSRIDRRLPVHHALALAQALQDHGKEYELVVYSNDGHSLPRHRDDRNRRIVEWFKAHLAR
jgi:dipeptidyl aminopeptidase/acylaminoacyl peptidase